MMKYDCYLYLRCSLLHVTDFPTMLSTNKCGEPHSYKLPESTSNKGFPLKQKKRSPQRSDRSKHKKTN